MRRPSRLNVQRSNIFKKEETTLNIFTLLQTTNIGEKIFQLEYDYRTIFSQESIKLAFQNTLNLFGVPLQNNITHIELVNLDIQQLSNVENAILMADFTPKRR
jgi:hypothetical protein